MKTLDGFDFSFQPSLDRNRILLLVELAFIGRTDVVHLLGPPGTGKSYLAIALGFEAIRAGKSVFFATLAEIINSLLKAHSEGDVTSRLRTSPVRRCRSSTNWATPLVPGRANLFIQLVNAHYEKGAMIITYNNCGFRDRGAVFGDNVVAAALLDRLLHHAIVIERSSYRLREHARPMPDPLHPTTAATKPKRRRGRPRKTEAPASLDG